MTIDYLIGEVVVHADNVASWRALEKAGLVRVASGELEPDNPVDDRRHHVYRTDRPGDLPAVSVPG